MKGFGALNSTQKTSALCKVPLKKNQENMAKIVKNGQNCQKLPFFLVFFRNCTLQGAEVFCVAFSASKPFISAIKINNPTIFYFFFTLRGNPSDLGGLKFYQHRK